MSDKPNKFSEDLQGAGKLTVEALTGIVDIVESLHFRILSFGGMLGMPGQDKTKGITGLVYRIIRTITKLAGGGIDIMLERFSLILNEKESSPKREAVISALNGVLGDYLQARNNPLAIQMQFRRNGKLSDVNELSEEIRKSKGKLVIMLHGICMSDLQWERKGHSHGAALADDTGIIPVYLRYNTGLHISENGKNLSELLEKMYCSLAESAEIIIIAHSMGGLLARSACRYGEISGHRWLNNLKKIIFLGTPHHGALLEKGGNRLEFMLQISPYSAPFARLGKIRSCGVTDLRYGNITDEDWQGRDRFKLSVDRRISVPLPESVQCYAIAATKGKESSNIGDKLIGDGLVTVNSAFGFHTNAEFNLLFPAEHKWIARGINHFDLLNNQEVYNRIKNWSEI